jgi:colanic acid/amylovoran biosynthesis glycosyltransferase
MPNHSQKICIAAHDFDVYSETFIRQHVENLPFDVVRLAGSQLGHAPGGPLQKSKRERVWHYLLRKMGRFDDRTANISRMADWMRRQKLSAILAEFGTMGVRLTNACEQAEVPLIVHFHGYDAYCEDVIVSEKKNYLRMFAQAHAIIGVSGAMCGQLRAMGAPFEKIHCVPSYVNPKDFSPASPQEANPTFLAVGRFVEKKAPQLTVLAFSKALAARPDIRLEMVGDGPLLGSCQWLARALNVGHAIIFHGRKNHEWVASAMKRVRAFIQHSVRANNGDSEGTPVAVLEAQCSGLPVVATYHTGIAEAVIDGETGFLCEEGDVGRMAQSIIRMHDIDAAELRAISCAARERFLKEFSREKTLDKLAGIIRQAIHN